MNDQSIHSASEALQAAAARGSYRQAVAEAEAAIAADAEDDAARLRLAQALLGAGDLAGAHAHADLVTRFAVDWPRREEAWRITIATAPFATDLDVLDLRALAQRWSGHLAIRRLERQPPPPVSRPRERALWVAYILSELPAGTRFLPLDGHDGGPVQARTYWRGRGPAPDPRMVDLSDLSDREAAETVRRQDADFLIDLCPAGSAATDMLAMARPARVQVGWVNRLLPDYDFGHDWQLGDAVLFGGSDFAEEEGARRHLLPVPVIPFAEMLDPAPPPERSMPVREHPTLAALPDAALVDSATLDFWADLAARLPNARFVVTTSILTDLLADRILGSFERNGVALDRVTLVAGRRHADGFAGVDLMVDGLVSGTAFDTLAACRRGVPVLAPCGDRQVRRRAAAVLEALGHGELVVPMADKDSSALTQAVLALAADPERLHAYRRLLPDAVARTGLADPARTMARLEEGLAAIWERALAGARTVAG